MADMKKVCIEATKKRIAEVYNAIDNNIQHIKRSLGEDAHGSVQRLIQHDMEILVAEFKIDKLHYDLGDNRTNHSLIQHIIQKNMRRYGKLNIVDNTILNYFCELSYASSELCMRKLSFVKHNAGIYDDDHICPPNLYYTSS